MVGGYWTAESAEALNNQERVAAAMVGLSKKTVLASLKNGIASSGCALFAMTEEEMKPHPTPSPTSGRGASFLDSLDAIRVIRLIRGIRVE